MLISLSNRLCVTFPCLVMLAALTGLPSARANDAKTIKACKAATALVDMGVLGSGTAFCIKQDGLFLTNRHVVEGVGVNKTVKLVLNPAERNERVVEARVVDISKDQELDLALLKVEKAGEFTTIPLGKDLELFETMSVTAFGYPFGRLLATNKDSFPAISINVGRISALRKSKGRLKVIQIDAAINPGNSGGPVIDESGHVIGVIVAGATAARIIYSIPVDDVHDYLNKPLLAMQTPKVNYVDRQQPVVFELTLFEFNGANDPPDVELLLKHDNSPARRFHAQRTDTGYTVTAPPIDPALGNPGIKLVAQFGNETVATNLSGDDIAKQKVKIGSRELRLYEIRRIEKRDSLSIVTTVAGKKYAGQVTGLPELSGPSNAPVDATDADRLDFYAVNLGPLEVEYEIVASRNQMPLSKSSGVIELKSVPFAEPVEPIQQFADPFSPNLDSFLLHAKVDGRSDLYVTETGLVWEHFSWNAPGEQDAKGSYVTVDGRKWYLEWQENTGDRKTSISNQFPLKLGNADWEAVVISVQLNPQSPHDESRGKVTQKSNNRGIAVTIDDTVGGHSYYTILFRKRQFSEKALPRSGPPRTGRWTFEQTEENRIHDQSGQGNHGLLLRASADKAIVDVKNGAALNVTGKASVDLNQIGDFERTDAFSYGAWLKPKPGGSSPLAKMADSGSFQGYDIMLEKEKVFVHLVHSWHEGNAIKVGATAQLLNDTWQHVMITYDGSSKAAGVKIYLNGEVMATTVQADALAGSIRTIEPLRIGSRRGGLHYHGLITDVRIVDKELTAEQVREIAENRPE